MAPTEDSRHHDAIVSLAAALLNAVYQVHDVGHEMTDPCVLRLTEGGEVIWQIKLHPAESDFQQTLEIKDDEDGTFHPIPLSGPIVWSYPTLDSLCEGLSKELFLTDARKYQVHPWEKDESVSVVTLRRGYMPAPIFLRHPAAEVKTALDIIAQERRKGRMLAFAGQAPVARTLK